MHTTTTLTCAVFDFKHIATVEENSLQLCYRKLFSITLSNSNGRQFTEAAYVQEIVALLQPNKNENIDKMGQVRFPGAQSELMSSRLLSKIGIPITTHSGQRPMTVAYFIYYTDAKQASHKHRCWSFSVLCTKDKMLHDNSCIACCSLTGSKALEHLLVHNALELAL
jgi:hypothetical protein